MSSCKGLSKRRPGGVAVFADDGEKFGTWPDTQEHVYKNGWLRRFCDMIRGNGEWLETTTFARAVDATLPLGKVYLPDSSYREMTEWVLPSEKFQAFMGLVQTGQESAERGDDEAVSAGGRILAQFPGEVLGKRRDVRPDDDGVAEAG